MKKLVYIIILLFSVSFSSAQTDDVMVLEYVDWGTGSGVGIKIYNPTNQVIDLSEYTIFTLHNGNTSGGTSGNLSGNLQPGASKIYGNSAYCTNCPNGCNTLTINGVDGNDVIGIKKAITYIDMVGPLGTDTQLAVDGISDGLLHTRILRNSDNCIRYFDLAGTSIHSWPDDNLTNVSSWSNVPVASWTSNDGCITQSSFNFQIPDFQISADTTICEGTELNLDYSNLGFTSYEWVNENNNTAFITITDSGSYVLKVKNKLLCSAQDDILVDVEFCADLPPNPTPTVFYVADTLMIPNIITPNGDDINEQFVITGLDTSVITLQIFNRWGKMVYEKIDYKNNWDAEGLNDGFYYYHVILETDRYKGYVEVRR